MYASRNDGVMIETPGPDYGDEDESGEDDCEDEEDG
jgi:hypothetical protein